MHLSVNIPEDVPITLRYLSSISLRINSDIIVILKEAFSHLIELADPSGGAGARRISAYPRTMGEERQDQDREKRIEAQVKEPEKTGRRPIKYSKNTIISPTCSQSCCYLLNRRNC